MDEAQRKALREPFDKVGLLPKVTCQDCSQKRCNRHQRRECLQCHNYITTAHMHIDYVGHAAVTDRLLMVDPEWSWEPFSVGPDGLPALDRAGNLWIRLTVAGVTRIGVGDGKNAKELIGDAIRNAAMRFGVALDLWSKEELEGVDERPDRPTDHLPPAEPEQQVGQSSLNAARDALLEWFEGDMGAAQKALRDAGVSQDHADGIWRVVSELAGQQKKNGAQ